MKEDEKREEAEAEKEKAKEEAAKEKEEKMDTTPPAEAKVTSPAPTRLPFLTEPWRVLAEKRVWVGEG